MRNLPSPIHVFSFQETIALYEERLSAADAKRYEMEDNILALEEQLRYQAQPLSPSAAARHTSSATEIDNESLREQVQHLQRKISTLEDMLEDTRAAADRDDAAARERIKRYKEREEQMRLEVAESLKEVDRLAKAEERARLKVEEVEEALRESTVALENARAEVESMRAEVVVCPFPRGSMQIYSLRILQHLEGLNAENGSPRQASTPGRDSDDRAQLLHEIVQLKHSAEELEEFKAEHAVVSYL